MYKNYFTKKNISNGVNNFKKFMAENLLKLLLWPFIKAEDSQRALTKKYELHVEFSNN